MNSKKSYEEIIEEIRPYIKKVTRVINPPTKWEIEDLLFEVRK